MFYTRTDRDGWSRKVCLMVIWFSPLRLLIKYPVTCEENNNYWLDIQADRFSELTVEIWLIMCLNRHKYTNKPTKNIFIILSEKNSANNLRHMYHEANVQSPFSFSDELSRKSCSWRSQSQSSNCYCATTNWWMSK